MSWPVLVCISPGLLLFAELSESEGRRIYKQQTHLRMGEVCVTIQVLSKLSLRDMGLYG